MGDGFIQLGQGQNLALWTISFFLCLLGLGVYRYSFHPLARFPGPKLAALSSAYAFYYDCILGGKFVFKIQELHEQYGPIIRITPHELHVSDPDFIDELYTGASRPRDKSPSIAGAFGVPLVKQLILTDTRTWRKGIFATVPHDLHRRRRSALNPLFSKGSIAKIEPLIKESVQKLCDKLEEYAGTRKPINLSAGFACLASDVVIDYAFGVSMNYLSSDNPEFEPNLHDSAISNGKLSLFRRYFSSPVALLEAMPEFVAKSLSPTAAAYFAFQNEIIKHVDEIWKGAGQMSGKTEKTIFREILKGKLPEEEKTFPRLWQEAIGLVAAGIGTTAWSLSATTYHVLSNPEIASKLYQELEAGIPDVTDFPSLATLEKFPYLISCPIYSFFPNLNFLKLADNEFHTAVVYEGLRLDSGVSTRTPRVAREPLYYKGKGKHQVEYEIPAGTPVGMTLIMIQQDPSIFPNPRQFMPERWIDSNGKRRRDLEGYLVTFSKGTRQCIGINLAFAEMYFGIAAIFRNFATRAKLYETDIHDVVMKCDYFVPVAKSDSKGVRVTIDAA
ncbi:hypothetical protein FQN57_002313 [Myotisia sp. PD_48]|nr:hypothetical protein FQN57_002313 [Myotisia sp. PD_48]